MKKYERKKEKYSSGRQSKQFVSEIMDEQAKLVEAQSRLKKIIGTINERLNVLKVEELQLRSMTALAMANQPERKFDPSTSTKSYDFDTSTEVINKQDLSLDVSTATFFKQLVEEEDDDD